MFWVVSQRKYASSGYQAPVLGGLLAFERRLHQALSRAAKVVLWLFQLTFSRNH